MKRLQLDIKPLRYIIYTLVTLGILNTPQILRAQLTLDRIFASGEFRQERVGNVTWSEDGESFINWEASETQEGGRDLVSRSVENPKEKKLLVKAEQLIPAGKEKPLRVAAYSWSPDRSKFMLFTNTQRVWRTNTKGDYWVLDVNTNRLTRLGQGLSNASLMFAKFSPTGESVAYVSDFNLFVEELDGHQISKLTQDGTVDIINGTFDWVYEEEFGCQDGFRWSPDGKYLAYWQVDATDIKDFMMINNTNGIYPELIPVQYPKVGEDPSAVRVGMLEVATGKTTWAQVTGDQKQNYIPRLQWVGNKVLLQQINRHQNHLKYWLCETNGKAQQIYEETDKAWVDIDYPGITAMRGKNFLDEYKEGVLRLSEADGWRHIVHVPLDGSKANLLSPGEYDVDGVYMTSGDVAYVSASPENPTQRYLFQVKLDKPGKPKRLTPKEYPGVNRYNISPNGKYAVHTHSNANTPPTSHLVSLPKHKIIRTLAANDAYEQKMKALNLPQAEFFSITTKDGIQMDGRMFKPNNFDATKKYPVLFYVYGEPWGQTATDSWGNLWYYMLAEQGYVIITMDNRGTPSLKGREWRKSIYKNIGIINALDQAQAAEEVLKWDFVDKDRIAVWGWSGGGSMTLNLMFQYPDIYKTGMSVAPVAYQLYYDNIYQERYMGLLQEDKEPFVKGSPITYAKNLKGNLLVMHGTADDNVHYQNTEALINELILHNKIFQVMPYPNRSHGIYEGQNTTRHVYKMLTHYLNTHCPPGPRGKESGQ